MFYLSSRSLKNLVGVNEKLVDLVTHAIKITDIDFSVLEGVRTINRQKILFDKGASKTMNSKHLTGEAVDIGAMIGNKVIWSWPIYEDLSLFIKQAAVDLGINVEWGGDWELFRDGVHWQLKGKK